MYTVFVFLGFFVYSSAYENLALLKPTWQSSSHNDTISGSHKAVDGLKTYLTYHGGQCGVSADKRTTATWWVNLTDIQRIHNIMIHYRTDHLVWNSSNQFTRRFMGFSLYVSNTTSMEDGFLCFHDRNCTRATIPAIVNIRCPYLDNMSFIITKDPQETTTHLNTLCLLLLNFVRWRYTVVLILDVMVLIVQVHVLNIAMDTVT
ncbi:uncharacterized protein LOC134261136 [Saccostrea cucullata]|uniref:uncharacterized protein LOC134261136 n=1 Tax=Saccostrea cuccullata TaxID=36930 RepID=UPI002ED2D2EC